MKSIALTKLSIAIPPQLRDLVMDPAARTAAPCCRLLPAGAHRRSHRLAIDHLVQALTGLVAGLALPELLCLVDGNQDESRARPWLAGLPTRRDRTRALLGLLLKELKEPQNFDGLIRLHEPDFARWLPALARRALKHGLPATLCLVHEPALLVTVEPTGELRCYSPDEPVRRRIAELAPSLGLVVAPQSAGVSAGPSKSESAASELASLFNEVTAGPVALRPGMEPPKEDEAR